MTNCSKVIFDNLFLVRELVDMKNSQNSHIMGTEEHKY